MAGKYREMAEELAKDDENIREYLKYLDSTVEKNQKQVDTSDDRVVISQTNTTLPEADSATICRILGVR